MWCEHAAGRLEGTGHGFGDGTNEVISGATVYKQLNGPGMEYILIHKWILERFLILLEMEVTYQEIVPEVATDSKGRMPQLGRYTHFMGHYCRNAATTTKMKSALDIDLEQQILGANKKSK